MHRGNSNDRTPRHGEDAQTMTEYAVVLSVITLAIMLTIQLLGDSSGNLINEVVDALNG